MKIPKVFHFTWLGPRPLDERYRKLMNTWAPKHPDWEVKLWTSDNCPPPINQKEFEETKSFVQKSDMLRYQLLYEQGGVYVDLDFECFRNIESLLEHCVAFVSSEDEKWLGNSIMGSMPGHPLFEMLNRRLPESFRQHPNNVSCATASVYLTRVFERFTDVPPRLFWDFPPENSTVRVFPPNVFFPVRYDGKVFGELDQAYGRHWWLKGWKDSDRQGL